MLEGGWESNSSDLCERSPLISPLQLCPFQSLVDEEELYMMRRHFMPMSTETFNYASYHTLDEVQVAGEDAETAHWCRGLLRDS